jgi:hypothetical protein
LTAAGIARSSTLKRAAHVDFAFGFIVNRLIFGIFKAAL